MTPLQSRLIDTDEDFAALEKEWRDLLSGSQADNFFLTWEWVSAWWRAFGAGKSLHVLALRDGAQLVGLAPFYIRRTIYYGVLPARSLMFLGTGECVRSEYQDLIVRPGREAAVVAAVAAHLRESAAWDIAVFKDLRGSSPLASYFADAAAPPELAQSAWQSDDAYAVRLDSSFADYLRSLDKHLRGNINTRLRNLAKRHSVSFEVLTDRNKLPEWMNRLGELHQKRMRQKNLAGKFRLKQYENFHRAVAGTLFDCGRLMLTALSLDGRPAAMRYGFLYNNKVYGYQTGFDPAFAREGVMQALTSRLIEFGISAGYSEIDFLGGREEYKARLANTVRRLFTFTVFSRTARGRTARLANRLRAGARAAARRRDWRAIFSRPLRTVRSYRFFTRPIGQATLQSRLVPEVEARRVTTAETAAVAAIARMKGHADDHTVSDRLRRGHICLAALAAEKPVAFIWVDPTHFHLGGGDASGATEPGEAFIYDCLTSGRWRGMNIYPFLLDCAARELTAAGFTKMSMLINGANSQAVKAAQKAGFRASEKGYRVVTIIGIFKKTTALESRMRYPE